MTKLSQDSLVASLRRTLAVLRTLGIVMLVVIAVMGFRSLYDFYSGRVGLTAPRAIETYFFALADGDLDRVYALTDTSDLTDLAGNPLDREAFVRYLVDAGAGQGMLIEALETNKLLVKPGVHCYEVFLTVRTEGSVRQSRVLVEVRREDRGWLMSFPFAVWP